eukprot:TRINITY_DN33872_c0_g1_i1.p1 TRINITY_DN33872_c0_g1~~TRINITY_DN33872_c0_g1_i1.p1  ORF type:complete len:287 (-),score=11.24 TRINITY_DN33872_c0_g1_i1:11-871(-)
MERLSVAESLVASGMAVVGATALTHPIDVVKVRLQLASSFGTDSRNGSRAARADAFSLIRFVRFWPALYQQEGATAFVAGVGSATCRAATYGAARIGLCEPFQNQTGSQTGGALLAGVFATVLGNPFEVLKVRLQARQDERGLNEVQTMRKLVKEEGLSALGRGFHWASTRSALLTASQVVPYSKSKEWLQSTVGLHEGLTLHVAASLAAGIVTTTVTSPVDVMKTRVMSGIVKGPAGSLTNLLRQDGPVAFFRGWLANYVRIGPQTLFIFVFYEQTKRAVLTNRW